MAPDLLPRISRARFEELVVGAVDKGDPMLALCIYLGGACGMRELEAHHLVFDDFHKIITRGGGRRGAYMRLPTPIKRRAKNGVWPPRFSVYLTDERRTRLRKFVRIISGRGVLDAHGAFLFTRYGTPWNRATLRSRWRLLLRDMRIPFMPFNALRQMFCDHEFEAPVPAWYKHGPKAWVARQLRLFGPTRPDTRAWCGNRRWRRWNRKETTR